MKLNKTSFKVPKTILYFVLFLLIDKIFDFVPKEAMELFIIIWSIGNFIFFVFEIYSVTTKKQYTKTIYIVLVDILIIPASITIFHEKVTKKEILGAFISIVGVAILFIK